MIEFDSSNSFDLKFIVRASERDLEKLSAINCFENLSYELY